MSERLRLRQISYDYALEINKFWERDWSEYTLPDDSSKIIDAVAVDDSDKPIAYGQVKLFAELMLFTDMQAPVRDRVEALHLLMQEAYRGIDTVGIPECYCLIKDIRFARLIAKHFGFHLVQDPGVLLVKKMR